MEERTGEARGPLFDSRGEGSDVISTSVILLSKSILCLFVFNILPAPQPGCMCVCLLELWGGEGMRRWEADYQMERECLVSLLAAHVLSLRLFFFWGGGGNTGINCCIFIFVHECVYFWGGGVKKMHLVKKINIYIFSLILTAPSNLSCSVNHACCHGDREDCINMEITH